MTNSENMIDRLVSMAAADYNLCAAAFEVIANAPAGERGSLLRRFLLGFRETPISSSLELPAIVTIQDVAHFAAHHSRAADDAMVALMEQELPEEAFYSALWDYIASTDELPEDQTTRICALHNFAIDRRLPYYRLNMGDAMTMDDETFQNVMDRIGTEKLAKMSHILHHGFDQCTQEASLLLDMLLEFPDRETQAVFLVQMLGELRMDAERSRRGGAEMSRMLQQMRDAHPDDDEDDDDEDGGSDGAFDALAALSDFLSAQIKVGDDDPSDGGQTIPTEPVDLPFRVGIDFGEPGFYPGLDLDDFEEAADGDPDGIPTIFPEDA